MVSQAGFIDNVHNSAGCTGCHAGDKNAESKESAHEGLITHPSDDAAGICSQCHGATVGKDSTSVHSKLHGYVSMIDVRSGGAFDPDAPNYKAKYESQCAKCHTSCGQCHISRPASVGGGFMAGHALVRTPAIIDNCTACHGSRVGEEYLGSRPGYKADVHWNPNAMSCIACHNGSEMHADGRAYDKRYDVEEMPRCEDCHLDDASANIWHTQHWTDLQCQGCHSQEYKNCYSCHAGDGLQEPSTLGFKIGRNPLPDKRGYDFVVLRHAPVDPSTFADWGLALTNFAALPTWKYASPHNIRRNTPQTDTTGTGSCAAVCHNSETVFLRAADLRDYEVEANAGVVVPDGPAPWDE